MYLKPVLDLRYNIDSTLYLDVLPSNTEYNYLAFICSEQIYGDGIFKY